MARARNRTRVERDSIGLETADAMTQEVLVRYGDKLTPELREQLGLPMEDPAAAAAADAGDETIADNGR